MEIIVQRANVILRVTENEKDRFLAQGFCVVDENGAVLEEGQPTDFASYRVAWANQRKQIEELKAEIEQLKAELAKATPKKKSTKTAEAE